MRNYRQISNLSLFATALIALVYIREQGKGDSNHVEVLDSLNYNISDISTCSQHTSPAESNSSSSNFKSLLEGIKSSTSGIVNKFRAHVEAVSADLSSLYLQTCENVGEILESSGLRSVLEQVGIVGRLPEPDVKLLPPGTHIRLISGPPPPPGWTEPIHRLVYMYERGCWRCTRYQRHRNYLHLDYTWFTEPLKPLPTEKTRQDLAVRKGERC